MRDQNPVSKGFIYWAQVVIRFPLGFAILPYGISKLVCLQFQVPAFVYTRPLGEIHGTMLTWAFLGYAPWFQVLLGLLETIPGLLLFFQRTQRLGAILLLPMTLNVFLMNYAMDLWAETKLISSVLLCLNLLLLATDWPLYRKMVLSLVEGPTPSAGSRRLRIETIVSVLAAACALMLAILALVGGSLRQVLSLRDFIGPRQINRAGSWTIEQLTVGSNNLTSTQPEHLYFDFAQGCIYRNRQDVIHRGTFVADLQKHTFSIKSVDMGGGSDEIAGSYQVRDDELQLDGTRDGEPIHILLRRDNWGTYLPFQR